MSVIPIARCIGLFVWFSDLEPASAPKGLAKATREYDYYRAYPYYIGVCYSDCYRCQRFS